MKTQNYTIHLTYTVDYDVVLDIDAPSAAAACDIAMRRYADDDVPEFDSGDFTSEVFVSLIGQPGNPGIIDVPAEYGREVAAVGIMADTPLNKLRVAEALIRTVRDLVKDAGAPRTLDRVRKTITSLGGAVRHAEGMASRVEQEGRANG